MKNGHDTSFSGTQILVGIILFLIAISIDKDVSTLDLIASFSTLALVMVALQAKNDWLNAEIYRTNRILMSIVVDTQVELNSFRKDTIYTLISISNNLTYSFKSTTKNYASEKFKQLQDDIEKLHTLNQDLNQLLNKRAQEFRKESVKIDTEYGRSIFSSISTLLDNNDTNKNKIPNLDIYLHITTELVGIKQEYQLLVSDALHHKSQGNISDITVDHFTEGFNEIRTKVIFLVKDANLSFRKASEDLENMLNTLNKTI